MARMLRLAPAALLFCISFFVSGCGCTSCDEGPVGVLPPPDTTMQDFALADVNPNSITYQTDVSPRYHIGHISAWYFGSAT